MEGSYAAHWQSSFHGIGESEWNQIVPPSASASLSPMAGTGAGNANGQNNENDGSGNYFRHYTSQAGQAGIRGSGYVYNSSGGEYGPGAYFTTALNTAADVRVTGSTGDYYVDAWVPNQVQSGGNWHNWGGGQYTYYKAGEPGYPIYSDPYHTPIFGKT
ncbi:MAG: hypothetical protein HQL12_00865 [Candidatus Omnitrophica bacterium]|nr:hypothetical protein [Candidatus Omnitrophota bacterium]